MSARGFATVPNKVLQDASISRSARLLYAVLLGLRPERDWSVLATHPQLAGYLGVGQRQVMRLADELAAAGWLEWEPGGRGRPNRYELKEIVPRSRPTRRARPDLPGGIEAQPLSVGAEVLAVPAQEATELEDDGAVLQTEDASSAGVGAAQAARDAARTDTSRARIGLGIARHDHESTRGGGR